MSRRQLLGAACAASAALSIGSPAASADLFAPDRWPALASDRAAAKVGDSLMVVVYENAQASNSKGIESRKSTRLSGQAKTDSGDGGSADLGMTGAFEGRGQQGRSGTMLAQISVVVDALLPNGDLHVTGSQVLNIDGERTTLRLSGRARPVDIYQNTIVSSRLSDVLIDYNGSGFVSRSGRPGVIANVFNWLGVL